MSRAKRINEKNFKFGMIKVVSVIADIGSFGYAKIADCNSKSEKMIKM